MARVPRRGSTAPGSARDAETETGEQYDAPEDEYTESEEEGESNTGSGWDDWQKGQRSSTKLELEDDVPQLLKFPEDSPFAVYDRYWVQQTYRYYYGYKNDPLKATGLKPVRRAAFNVIPLVVGDTPVEDLEVFVLDAPPTLAHTIKKNHEDKRKGPLREHYWELVQRNGKGKGKTTYEFSVVFAENLEKMWDVAPLEDEEIADLEESFYTEENYPYKQPISENAEAARAVVGGKSKDDAPGRSRSRR